MIEEPVAPLLHKSEPLKPEAVNTELSQLLTTSTVGGSGFAFGAAIAFAEGLVQPFTDCVTVYVPAVVTVIDAVVSPVLHNNEPVTAEAVNNELPQLLVVFTVGGSGVVFGAEVPLPSGLVQPFTD